MPDRERVQVSRRARRVLRSILPVGVMLLVVWVALLVWQVAAGSTSDISVVSKILGLITSITLIVTGVMYRRELPPEH